MGQESVGRLSGSQRRAIDRNIRQQNAATFKRAGSDRRDRRHARMAVRKGAVALISIVQCNKPRAVASVYFAAPASFYR
jgi:hypothetical protein